MMWKWIATASWKRRWRSAQASVSEGRFAGHDTVTVPAYVFGEHYSVRVVGKKQKEFDQDPEAEQRWAHDEALVTLCRIAVVDE